MQSSVSVTSSLVDNNFFESLSANEPDRDWHKKMRSMLVPILAVWAESGSDSDEVEITNEEVSL